MLREGAPALDPNATPWQDLPNERLGAFCMCIAAMAPHSAAAARAA